MEATHKIIATDPDGNVNIFEYETEEEAKMAFGFFSRHAKPGCSFMLGKVTDVATT